MLESLASTYFSRIGVPPSARTDLPALRRIVVAHVASIPFENLEILLGRPIRLDIESLRAKLIDRRRGGYCFEQNTLLLAVLRDLGFEARAVEARVRTGTLAIRPRTHMAIVVNKDEHEWLVDVGFGGEGPLEPVPMTGTAVAQGGLEYRVTAEGPTRILQMRTTADWMDQYAFVPGEVHPVDFEMANWFTSTHPHSPFVRMLTAQRATTDARYVLRYPNYSELRGGSTVTRVIARPELMPLLREVFLIDLPDDTTFATLDVTPS
jgi:N-hydroxyarylamine O-acetyltransferase